MFFLMFIDSAKILYDLETAATALSIGGERNMSPKAVQTGETAAKAEP